MTPTPKPHSPEPDLTPFLTRFRPEFDPILTSWGDLGSKSGQIQIEIGSERGSKSGRGEWGLGSAWHRSPLKSRDFHRKCGTQTQNDRVQTPPPSSFFYVRGTVLIGGWGGLQFVENDSGLISSPK